MRNKDLPAFEESALMFVRVVNEELESIGGRGTYFSQSRKPAFTVQSLIDVSNNEQQITINLKGDGVIHEHKTKPPEDKYTPQAGDTVVLKSGGLTMTVNARLTSGAVQCVWIDRAGLCRQADIYPVALRPYDGHYPNSRQFIEGLQTKPRGSK